MKLSFSRILCVGAVWMGFGATTLAQPPVPGGGGGASPPAFSPYLNLLRSGSPTLNYYGLVRPEMQFQQSIQNLQSGLGTNQQAIGTLQNDLNALPGTGHPIQFQNHRAYFLTNGAGGPGGNRSGGGTGAPSNTLRSIGGGGVGGAPGIRR